MRILVLGDIVGEPGRKLVVKSLPALRKILRLDVVIANAENAAGGSGLTPKTFAPLRKAGIDAVTMGDHIYKKTEIYSLFDKKEPICKPANFPPEAPGPDHTLFQTPDGTSVAVISVLGRIFTRPVDCPLAALDRVLDQIGSTVRVIIVDAHAEATSEKQIIFRYVSGRVSAVLGTHTHVPTADAMISEDGTAYMTDLGMCGPYHSIIGRRIDKVLATTKTFQPLPFDVAVDDPRLSGVILTVDENTGRAESIEPFHKTREEVESLIDHGYSAS